MALKPETSPRMAVAIAQVDESSLAVSTRRPELMRAWVWTRLRAVVLMDCRAAIAPTFVRMLDIEFLPHKSDQWMHRFGASGSEASFSRLPTVGSCQPGLKSP